MAGLWAQLGQEAECKQEAWLGPTTFGEQKGVNMSAHIFIVKPQLLFGCL